MPAIKRTKRRKKVRYSKLTLKLSSRQKKSLENYCIARKTTPTKLVKKMIQRFLNGFDKQVPDSITVSEKQLELFREEL